MKKYLFAFFMLLTATCFAQDNSEKTSTVNTVSQESRFKLYPTSNIYIFLKLDSRTGKIWMVQYSTKDGRQMQVPLSLSSACFSSEEKNGRFSLYPTKNMYNFIMIDHENGNCWQVQWSVDADKRMVIPIL